MSGRIITVMTVIKATLVATTKQSESTCWIAIILIMTRKPGLWRAAGRSVAIITNIIGLTTIAILTTIIITIITKHLSRAGLGASVLLPVSSWAVAPFRSP